LRTIGYLPFIKAFVSRRRPVYAHYAVTGRCNLRCRTCAIWKNADPDNELPIEKVEELAGVLRKLDVAQVSLGGGEPAVRSDLPELVGAFLRHGIRARVLTNGVAMTPEIVERLLSVGRREVSCSLDSLNPQVQNFLDGGEDAFAQRIDNLFYLAKKLPRTDCQGLLNTVVSPLNLMELPQLLAFAESIGFSISYIPIHLAADDDHAHRFFGHDRRLRFAEERQDDLHMVYNELLQAKKRGRPIVNSSAFLRRSPNFLLKGVADWPCRAGQWYISIAPDGRVSPCHAFESRWSVDYRDLISMVQSGTYAHEAKRIIASCEGCFRPCWAEIAFLMSDAGSLWEMMRFQLRAMRRRPEIDPQRLRSTYQLG